MQDTAGRRALAAYLGTGRTQKWLSEVLGVKQPTVSHWLRGAWRPPPELRKALFDIAGIPVDAWLTFEELERYQSALDKAEAA